MNNFIFYNPTKILFGKGQISSISDEIPEDAKVLLIYGGGSIKANGIYDQVVEALGGIEYYEFPGIEPNPTYEKCMKALELIEENNIDFILAAARYYQGVDPWDILAHNEEVIDALPLGVVLTLPATGTEMNGNSVITRAEFKEKLAFSSPLVLPLFSVLDPEVVATLPPRQIGNGVVDAFVHVIEQYLTYPVNAKIQDRIAEGVMLTLIEEGPKVMKDPSDFESAANFMWAATMALNGLISRGVPEDWTTHNIGHEITALHGVDHARTLAIVLPGVMNVMRESKKLKIIQYGQRIWGINEPDEEKAIDKAIAMTIGFFESMGLPTRMHEYKIPVLTIEEIVERMEERGSINIGENKLVGSDEIRKILKDRY